MIEKREIEQKAKEFGVGHADIQKDYVFGWLLCGIFTQSSLKTSLFLKGGNALRKAYFPETRYSADLDFGTHGDLSQDAVREELNKVCDFIRERAGVTFENDRMLVKDKFEGWAVADLTVYEVRIYFKDFHGKADHISLRISMDLTLFDKVLLPIQTRALIHPYSDATAVACTIPCMKLEEIIATKLKCLIQREHAPDLYDYVYTIRSMGGTIDRSELVRTFLRKTIFDRNPHVAKNILVKTPWDFWRRTWEKGVVCAKAVVMTVDDAIAFFVKDLEDLFKDFRDTGRYDFVFFAAEHRVPIMAAARSQTLLKLHYRGEERLVEPYALKYMQQKNGQQREYFYAYNQSGGKNPPGMRSFVADGVEAIEATETKFEPRFDIELSKAGEMPEDKYLFDPNKPTRAPRPRGAGRTSFRTTFGPKYIYQCPLCQRTFTRSTRDPQLRAHKDPNGFLCRGSRGYLVDTQY